VRSGLGHGRRDANRNGMSGGEPWKTLERRERGQARCRRRRRPSGSLPSCGRCTVDVSGARRHRTGGLPGGELPGDVPPARGEPAALRRAHSGGVGPGFLSLHPGGTPGRRHGHDAVCGVCALNGSPSRWCSSPTRAVGDEHLRGDRGHVRGMVLYGSATKRSLAGSAVSLHGPDRPRAGVPGGLVWHTTPSSL